MAPRDRAVDRATLRTVRDLGVIARELRAARLIRGLTQGDVGRAAGVSGQYVGRIERSEGRGAAPVVLSRVVAAAGLELSMRVFPSGVPIRDAGHVALLERLHARLGPVWRWQVEVRVTGGSDMRAWDAVAEGAGVRLALEAETRLYDVQAQVRQVLGSSPPAMSTA
jgi:transcriptional regulator with XRE-family HTH domain